MEQRYTWQQLRDVTMKVVMQQIDGEGPKLNGEPISTMKLAFEFLNLIEELQGTIDAGQFSTLMFVASRLFFYAINEDVDENNRMDACDKAFDRACVSIDPNLLDKYLRSSGEEAEGKGSPS